MPNNINEIIENMSPEDQQTMYDEYKAKLEAAGQTVHHKAKLATLVTQWITYQEALEAAEEEVKVTKAKRAKSAAELRMEAKKEATKLIRVKIINNNPRNTRFGEVVTTGNSLIHPPIRKTVPYNCEAAEAYHLPKIMLETLKERKYVHRSVRTDKKTGRLIEKEEVRPEFTFIELEPLTQEDLAVMREQQKYKGDA